MLADSAVFEDGTSQVFRRSTVQGSGQAISTSRYSGIAENLMKSSHTQIARLFAVAESFGEFARPPGGLNLGWDAKVQGRSTADVTVAESLATRISTPSRPR